MLLILHNYVLSHCLIHNRIVEYMLYHLKSNEACRAYIDLNYYTTLFNNLIGRFDPGQQHAILRAKASSSSWLSVVPLESHQFDLVCQEFRDALALRYRKPLLGLPPYCDGPYCDGTFNRFFIRWSSINI